MADSAFVQLASGLVEAMGQRLDSAKPVPEGLILQTNDGFLYAFLEDPTRVSLEGVRRLLGDEGDASVRLVVLTPGRLPLVLSAEVVRRGGTVVEGTRFAELARQLGLESLLGEEPRARPEPPGRLLPSAQQLDQVVHRARTWLEWGVPALALRFFRQAAEMKPGFLPAKIGVGRSLLALGLPDDAERQYDEVLAVRPDDVEARLGKAAVLGAKAEPEKEVAVYRELLAEDEARTEVRAHLVAALVDLGNWPSAQREIEAMLTRTPEDAQLRFLHAVALEKTGAAPAAARERVEARSLGLSYEREVALCEHLGLAAPHRPVAGAPGAPPAGGAPAPAPPRAPARAKPAARRRAASNRRRPAPTRKRK
jgi:tetratricopeptide (TPR) repeat protein